MVGWLGPQEISGKKKYFILNFIHFHPIPAGFSRWRRGVSWGGERSEAGLGTGHVGIHNCQKSIWTHICVSYWESSSIKIRKWANLENEQNGRFKNRALGRGCSCSRNAPYMLFVHYSIEQRAMEMLGGSATLYSGPKKKKKITRRVYREPKQETLRQETR